MMLGSRSGKGGPRLDAVIACLALSLRRSVNLSLGKVLRRFDMRCLDYARPLGDVGFDAHGKLSRRVHNWLETERGHLALRVERPDGVRDRLVELGNDRLWRPSRDENTALLRCLTCQLWPRPDFPVRIPTRCLPVSFNG